ncbi:unnamed protein product [Aspergillus oryzae]|nr:unnamed protein product [Aspergillus oryzae]
MGIHYHHDISALETLKLQPISRLAPFSALIISIVLVVLFVVRYYVLEGFLIKRLYGSIYTNLSEVNRRGFINHHIAGLTKILILIVAAYPFLEVVIGKSSFHTPYAHGSRVTMGDMLVVVAQMLIGMYAFELIYRTKLSPIAVLHHIGTIIIGQSAIAISLDLAREPDADIEFVLCTVWGKSYSTFLYYPFKSAKLIVLCQVPSTLSQSSSPTWLSFFTASSLTATVF